MITNLFAGNGSRFRLLVEYLPPLGVTESIVGATIVASLVAEDGTEIIADAAQSDTAADGASWATSIIAIVFPSGASGTDAAAVTAKVGQRATIQVSITKGGATETFLVPGAVAIRAGV